MRTPLRKLLKKRSRRSRAYIDAEWLRENTRFTGGVCTCEHPRSAHRKRPPPFSRKAYHCTVKDCRCYIAANVLKPRPPREGRGPRRRGI